MYFRHLLKQGGLQSSRILGLEKAYNLVLSHWEVPSELRAVPWSAPGSEMASSLAECRERHFPGANLTLGSFLLQTLPLT